MVEILKAIVVLVAAITVGNWFLAELRRIRAQGKPWYWAYFSWPGLLILIAVALPIFIWLYNYYSNH